MTDQFIAPTQTDTGAIAPTEATVTDPVTVGEGGVDTRSPEYQIQKMQQRLADKDQFIETLKEENQSTREMVATMQERLQNLEAIKEVLTKGDSKDASSQDTGLDEDALAEKIIANLSKREQEERLKANYDSVVNRLTEEFGQAHVNDKVKSAAEANGLSVSDMLDTAKRSPKAFYKLMGLEGGAQPTFQQPTKPSNMGTTTHEKRDLAYFSQLMRTNPTEYWKPETQREFRKLFIKDKN